MADPIMIQKQIKDNNEDLHNFVRDLKLWEEEMKRKDRQLSSDKSVEVLPPVRRAKLSKQEVNEKKSEVKQSGTENKRIRSNDYKAWDNFDVEKACEEVDKDAGAGEVSDDTDDDAEESQQKHMKEKALYEKDVGNKHVKAGRWDEAIEAYSRAITAYPKDPVFFANRALCYLNKNKYEVVESDCTESLKLDGTYVKALLRRAAARERLANTEGARGDLTLALQLEPHNPQAHRDLHRLNRATVTKSNNVKEAAVSEPVKKHSNARTGGGSEPLTNTEASRKTSVKEMEPNWKPCGNTIEPTTKPPHLRSKKSLKRIEVFDVGRNVPQQQHTCARLAGPEQTAATPLPPSVHTVSCVPPPPVSSVQFHMAWKAIRCDKQMCYQFLKQIPGETLPDIFKESLESSVFGEIVATLCSEFTRCRGEGEGVPVPVLPYLRGLSGVRRFAAIALFMTPADRTNVQKLFDHCLEKGECSTEEINNLRRIYETT